MNSSVSKAIQYILPLVLFIGILSIYFAPEFFEGKYLKQNDVLQGISAGHETQEFRDNNGEEALWNGTMFSGMPTYLINIRYSGDWVAKLHLALRFLPHTADAIFINFLGFYILLLCFRVNPWLSGIGAFTYAFSAFTIVSAEAGHIFKVLAIGYLPLVFGGIKLVFSNKKLIGFSLIALGTALELAAQHYQITFYGYILAGLMTLVYLFQERNDIKKLITTGAIVFFGVVIGLGPGIGRTWGVLEYNEHSIRGKKELTSENKETVKEGLDKEYAYAWSQGVWETMTIVIPNLYGGASGEELDKKSSTYIALKENRVPTSTIKNITRNAPTYWGPQPFTSGPIYFGIITIALFILGIYTLDQVNKTWLIAGALLFVFIALGKNFETFNYFLFDHVPMFNKFRAVAMALSITAFCMLLMGIIGLNTWLEKPEEERITILKKTTITSFGLVIGIWLISLFILSFEGPKDATYKFPEWLLDALIADRKSMFHMDTLRSLIFLLLGMATLYLFTNKTLQKNTLYIALACVVLLDLWTINKRYLNTDDFVTEQIKRQVKPDAADLKILADKTLSYRVIDMNNPFNNGITSFHHKSIGGYSGAKMQRYQDLIERHISQNNQKVWDMLNTKYIKTTDPNNPVVPRSTNLGNAWFVNSIKLVNNPNEEIDYLTEFNPQEECVIDKSKFDISTTEFQKNQASAELVSYQPNKMTYKTNNANDGFLVFSEIYYPEGWKITIDGKEAKQVRCNFVLRGLNVPAGEHTIEYRFEPDSYYIGNKISLFASILVFGLLFGAIFLEYRQKKTKKEDL